MDDRLQGVCPGGQQQHRSHGGLKIRKWPSSKCSAAAGAYKQYPFESFLEYGSYIRQEKKIRGPAVTKQPLIFHTVDPEIVMAEPGEFTSVVQRLTGSRQTRMALRDLQRRLKGSKSRKDSSSTAASPNLGRTPRLKQAQPPASTAAPLIDLSDTDVHPSTPSPAVPKSSKDHTRSSSTASPILGCTPRLKPQPLASSADSFINLSDTGVQPSSPSPTLPSPSPCPSAFPSPRSGLTTSCSDQGYLTDISTESCDSDEPSIDPYFCPAGLLELVGGLFVNEEEDGSSFFRFSHDSYYGNINHAAQLEQLEFNPASYTNF